MKIARALAALAGAVVLSAPAAAQQRAHDPLFSTDAPVQLTIRGPIDQIARAGPDSNSRWPATLAASGEAALPVTLEARGITRRQRDVCQFPPLRVTLGTRAPAGSLFDGQKKLKLVTHCRGNSDFQQKVLTEYAAYRIYNLLTPRSFRVRLAQIDYQDPGGKSVTTRYGFFIEDIADVAKRNGMSEPRVGNRIPSARLAPADAARFALFEYMIGNLDWAMIAGPAGDNCCHNSKLISTAAAGPFVPVPYDFDFSGLVNAPYAVAPTAVPVSSVRQRYYRGICSHNGQAIAALATFRAQRSAIPALLASIPGMSRSSQDRAVKFLDGFYDDIATDQSAQAKVLKTCR